MNEAEVRRFVNKKITLVLERLYNALYEAQRHPGIEFEVLRANIEEIAKEINNG